MRNNAFNHGRRSTKFTRSMRRFGALLILLIYFCTNIFGSISTVVAAPTVPTVKAAVTRNNWNKIFVKDPDGNYRDLASVVANPGDELELYVVVDNVPEMAGTGMPDGGKYGFWWNAAAETWPSNNWAHVEGEDASTWVLTTTIKVEKGIPATVNLAKDNFTPTDTLDITVVDLPADREADKIYVEIEPGKFVENTTNNTQTLKVNPGYVSLEAMLVGVKNMNGNVPDTGANTGSGFWGAAWTQNWYCLNTLKGIWIATATLQVYDNSNYTVNLAKDGVAAADIAYLGASSMGFFVKTDNGDMIVNPSVPYVLKLGETLEVYASFTVDIHNDYSVSLSDANVLDMNGQWSADYKTWSAVVTAKQVGECSLIKSIWGMVEPELTVKVLEEAPAYDADKLYVKTSGSDKFQKLSSVDLHVGDEFEVLGLIQSPVKGTDGKPETATYIGSGFWVDKDGITISDVRWIEYLNDLWMVTAKCKVTDGGRIVISLAKNGTPSVDSMSVLATCVDQYICVDNIHLGSKEYSGIGIHTATRMLTGDYRKNSQDNRYIVYVGETLDLSVANLETEDAQFKYEGNELELLSGEGTDVQYLGMTPGECKIELVNGEDVIETFYIKVRNPIYVETALGRHHKDVVHEYVGTALPNLPYVRPDLLITMPNLTALYVKNCVEYPYEMVVGDTVKLTAYGTGKISGEGLTDITSSTRTIGSMELRADKAGNYTVTFDDEIFYIHVAQDAVVNHFDIEVEDGGVYRIKEVASYANNRKMEIETFYSVKITEIKGCYIYGADDKLIHTIGKGEYWGRNTENYQGNTQYEFTSAYKTRDGKLVDENGVDITDAVLRGERNPVVETRYVKRSEIETVKFDVVLELIPFKQTRTMYMGDEIKELPVPEDVILETIKDKNTTVVLGALDLQDARNKCPDSSGADFVTNDFEEINNVFGQLTITKEVQNRDADQDKDFTFTINLTDPAGVVLDKKYNYCYVENGVDSPIAGQLGNGDTFKLKPGKLIKIDELPSGTHYEIVEKSVPGYEIVQDGTIGDIETGQVRAAKFTNVYEGGNLTVSKTVTGNGDTEKKFTFTITLYDDDKKVLTEVEGVYGDMTFTKGVATFTLKHGESKTAKDLPAGVNYAITESDNEGYEVSKTGDTGRIIKDKTAEAKFTNQKVIPATPQTGDYSSPIVWMFAMFVSLIGIVGMLASYRKRNKYQ